MFQKQLIRLMIFLVILASVFAVNESPNVVLTLVDAISKESVGNVFVSIELNGKTANYFLEQDKNLHLELAPGNYLAKFFVNNPVTQGHDYYGESYLTVEKSLVNVVYLYPVGSVDGFVKDKLNNVIKNADLKFECNNLFNQEFPSQADKFGSFSVNYLPIGHCKIYGGIDGFMGVQEIDIKQGQLQKVEIVLDQVVVQRKTELSFRKVGIILLLLVISGVGFYLWKKQLRKQTKETLLTSIVKKEQEVAKSEEKVVSEMGEKGAVVYQTLRDNEKKIIGFLLKQQEPTHLSKIHYKTGISKGALFRNLQSLERKKVVETIREGRVRKAALTSWFLEK